MEIKTLIKGRKLKMYKESDTMQENWKGYRNTDWVQESENA